MQRPLGVVLLYFGRSTLRPYLWMCLTLSCNHSLPLRASKVFRRSTKCASVLGRGALPSATRGLAGEGSSPSLLHVILVLVCEHVYGLLQSVLGTVGSLGIDNKVVGPVAHVVATHASVPTFGYIVPLV